MVSEELGNATLRLWKDGVNNADVVWAPWVNVSPLLGCTMASILGVLIENSYLFDRKVFPANRTKAFQELVRLADTSPWCELFTVLPNDEGLAVNSQLSKDDLELLHRARRRFIQACE